MQDNIMKEKKKETAPTKGSGPSSAGTNQGSTSPVPSSSGSSISDSYSETAKPKPKPVQPRPGFQGQRRPFRPGAPFQPGVIRVRLPKEYKHEVIGVIQENFGSKLLVRCVDGHTRTCRIPGKIRYKLRVKIGDVILVKKWTVQENEKGDYLYRYTPTQIKQLIKKGFLKEEDLEG